MKLVSKVLAIARVDFHFYNKYPKMWLAALVVVVIPALYAVIYLASVWDPAGKTGALPVAIVNLDQGIEYRQHRFNVGREVVVKLRAKHTFGYLDDSDEQHARRLVRQGALAFALIIPTDFSSNAIPGAQAGAGKLVIYTSEGNSYQSASLARRFAQDLGQEVNGRLNQQRWALVLSDAVGSQRSIEHLHDAVRQLHSGAKELASGANQTAKGAEALSSGGKRLDLGLTQLTAGAKELGSGLRSMEAQRPRNSEIRRMKEGAEALALGQSELGQGLVKLQAGSARLQDGVSGFREQANNTLMVTNQIKEELDQFGAGVAEIDSGLKSASAAQEKLADGAKQLSTGVGALAGGMRSFSTGLRSAIAKFPADSQLEDLDKGVDNLVAGAGSVAQGTSKVKAGAQFLVGGLDLLAGSLPVAGNKMEGSAEGLANSVQPAIEVVASVQNNGSGFAANILPGALWLGASLAVFLIYVRVLPRQARFYGGAVQVLGKILLPLAVVLLQSLLLLLSVLFLLKINVVNVGAFAVTLALSAVTFLLIVFALTRLFGDAGKALALVFLAVQISSSGGVLPVELSGGWFAQISPWLPITWVVKAIKASMFGAFEGDWQYPMALVALAGAVAAGVACTLGRWRFVKQASLRPVLDF